MNCPAQIPSSVEKFACGRKLPAGSEATQAGKFRGLVEAERQQRERVGKRQRDRDRQRVEGGRRAR